MNPERENRSRYATIFRDIPLLLTTAAAAVVIFVIVSRTVGEAADMQDYIELLSVIPCTILLLGLIFSVEGDPYVTAGNKRIMYVIELMVLCLILQNYVEYRLIGEAPGQTVILLRTVTSIFGYSIRPIILAMFIKIVRPERNYTLIWLAVLFNLIMYGTALFSGLVFRIDEQNRYVRGPMSYLCLVVSGLLLIYLFILTIRRYRAGRDESIIPTYVVLIIIGACFLDFRTENILQPVSFLTHSIVVGCTMYYIWLHMQFVREHEEDLQAQQRIRIMMTQIQPHFLYNTLMTIQALCLEDPQKAFETTGKFSQYLRQNLESLEHRELIPLYKELEHTRTYTEIEMLRFPRIRVEYDIQDDTFRLPALTIQPLVENAIRHGVRIREHGLVRVETRREGEYHEILILDNGKGFDIEKVENDGKTHIGIRNVRERIEKMCRGTLTVESRIGEGTRIRILIPAAEDLA